MSGELKQRFDSEGFSPVTGAVEPSKLNGFGYGFRSYPAERIPETLPAEGNSNSTTPAANFYPGTTVLMTAEAAIALAYFDDLRSQRTEDLAAA